MKTSNLTFLTLIIGIMLGILTAYYDVFWHESAHEQIFKHDGCQNITVNYIEGYTTCKDDNYELSKIAFEMHLMNEIVGYNLEGTRYTISVFAIFLSIIIIIVFNKEEKNDKKQELPPIPRRRTDQYNL